MRIRKFRHLEKTKRALENSGLNLASPVGHKTQIQITASFRACLALIFINTAIKYFGLAVLSCGNTE